MGFDVVVAASRGPGASESETRPCGVGHGLDVVGQGRAELPDRPQDLLPCSRGRLLADRHDTRFEAPSSREVPRPRLWCSAHRGSAAGELADEPQELFGFAKG